MANTDDGAIIAVKNDNALIAITIVGVRLIRLWVFNPVGIGESVLLSNLPARRDFADNSACCGALA